jgi:nitrite reductase/ring-hydroxylating ferredoxin subunit
VDGPERFLATENLAVRGERTFAWASACSCAVYADGVSRGTRYGGCELGGYRRADELSGAPLRRVVVKGRDLAVSFKDGRFGAVSNTCNHVGGPIGEGTLHGDYINCPWHNWKFHRCSGLGEPGFEEDAVPAYPVKVENGRVMVDFAAATRRTRKPHDPHPLSRTIERAPGPLRLAGISTTAMDEAHPRFSGSDHLLNHAVNACVAHGAEARLIRLSELKFRACEGYYRKAHAPAPGRARSPRWTRPIRWIACTRRWCIGRT